MTTTRQKRIGERGRLYTILTAAVLLAALVPGFLASTQAGAADETGLLLESAESLFKAMKGRDYRAIWKGLTKRSQGIIAGQTCEAMEKAGKSGCTVDFMMADFDAGGPLARTYWNAYLENLDVDVVLQQSVWDIDFIKGEKAVISLLYKNADYPAKLKMYKERNQWKVGLMETFGPAR